MQEKLQIITNKAEHGLETGEHSFVLITHPKTSNTLVLSQSEGYDDLVRRAVSENKMTRGQIRELRESGKILRGKVRHADKTVLLEKPPTEQQKILLAKALKKAWARRDYLITSNLGEKSHGRTSIILAQEKGEEK